jgi:hypothetical protein
MRSDSANGDSRLSFWPRVREFAVPPSMIETATVRRRAGDWAGACAAARVDVDLDLRSVARTHGHALAAQVRSDLRHLAPDLLRWHLPRIAPDGLLRPGLTVALARYAGTARDGGHLVHLVARTPPAWADAGQRISLALWDGARPAAEVGRPAHPRPRPHPRFRLDLHRHLWDTRRTGELRARSGADRCAADGGPVDDRVIAAGARGFAEPAERPDPRWAVDRWSAEAAILLRAEGRSAGPVTVRVGVRQQLLLHVDLVPGSGRDGEPHGVRSHGMGPHDLGVHGTGPGGTGPYGPRVVAEGACSGPPLVLPDAATWVLPDLALLRAGLIELDRLHPLVAAALATGPAAPDAPRTDRPAPTSAPDPAVQPRFVECRGARHRIGLVQGVLAPLDHEPAELQREELLAALTGTPLPCLRAIDEAHRAPESLPDVQARLAHGDMAGAMATVEALLGPDAVLRGGALRDELEAAAWRRTRHGLFRAGLSGPGPGPVPGPMPSPLPGAHRRTRTFRAHPRDATVR